MYIPDPLALVSGIGNIMTDPVPSFYFDVKVLDSIDSVGSAMKAAGASLLSAAVDDGLTAFAEIDGLEISLGVEDVSEAGWSVPHKTFKQINTTSLTLKRYLKPTHVVTGMSLDPFSTWCQDTIHAAKTWETCIEPKMILILIYHPHLPGKIPIASFMAIRAYPTKWAVSPLNSTDETSPLMETIELQYADLKRLTIDIPSPF